MLKELVELHKKFKELYGEKGLMGIDSDYLQVEIFLFKKLISPETEVTMERSPTSKYITLFATVKLEDYSLKIITLI